MENSYSVGRFRLLCYPFFDRFLGQEGLESDSCFGEFTVFLCDVFFSRFVSLHLPQTSHMSPLPPSFATAPPINPNLSFFLSFSLFLSLVSRSVFLVEDVSFRGPPSSTRVSFSTCRWTRLPSYSPLLSQTSGWVLFVGGLDVGISQWTEL